MDSIKFLNCVVIKDDDIINFADVNLESTRLGFIVEPRACTREVLQYFKEQKANFNSTFYRTFQEVQSKDRIEIWLDQCRHYSSTYGTQFEGKTWVSNNADDSDEENYNFSKYTVIKAVTKEELVTKCIDLIKTPVNLSNDLIHFLIEVFKNYENKEELIDSIHSIELQTALCVEWKIWPSQKFQLLRAINYLTIGETMIIQNNETIQKIKACAYKFDFSELNKKQMMQLSSIFLRYKNFFLAFKANKKNASYINKLRRMAVKNHQPLTPGFWETILSNTPSLSEVCEKLDECPKSKRITIIQTIRERRFKLNCRGYVIRNGKFFVKKVEDEGYLPYYNALEALLIGSLRSGIKVKMPKNFRIAMPTSTKNFIGNYPFGTKYQLKEGNAYVGVYWRNEWGTRDFDLACTTLDGQRIGWNSYFSAQGITFSGDMTNADPEASEIMHFEKEITPMIIDCNRYCGEEGSRFDLIFGQSESIPHQRCIDVNTIADRLELVSNSRQVTCGMINDEHEFVLMNIRTSDCRISTATSNMVEYLNAKSKCFLYIDEVFDVIPEDYQPEEGEEIIDLSEMTIDKVLSLIQ